MGHATMENRHGLAVAGTVSGWGYGLTPPPHVRFQSVVLAKGLRL
jgi:hypothetical protein